MVNGRSSVKMMGSPWNLPLGLTELRVAIGCDSDAPRCWRGTGRGDEELVALGMIAHEGALRWFKSPVRAAVLPVVLSLHPPEPVDGGYVVLEVGKAVGNVLSRSGRSLCVASHQALTGRPQLLATITGDPTIELGVLWLAARDVRFGRNRLWHLRPERARRVAEPFATLLAGGRGGTA